MFVAIVFLAASFLFGFLASYFFEFVDDWLKKIVFALLTGLLSATWLALALSWAFGELGFASISLTILVLLAASALFYKLNEKRFAKWVSKRIGFTPIAFILVVFAVFIILNIVCVLAPNARGGISSVVNVWGDYPLHIAIANSFVERANFPPQYPVLANTPLAYPFLMDFLSTILLKCGFALREAFIIPNLFIGFCLISLIYFFAHAFAENFGEDKKKRFAAFVVVLLFLFNGNAGILNALNDAQKNPRALFAPAQDYSHDEPRELYFMNLVYAIFIPQRSALLGFAVVLLVYWLLWRNAFEKNPRRNELLLAGILLGLLPLTHTHSFLVAGFLSVCLLAFNPRRDWKWFFVPAILLSTPQVFWIRQQATLELMGVLVGWISVNTSKPLLDVVVFWLRNAWIPLALVIPGFFFLTKKQKLFYAPFAAIFFAANVVRFQPWDWDNIKFFFHWFFFTAIVAAILLMKLFYFKPRKKSFFSQNAGKTAALVLIALSIASGVLTMLWMTVGDNARYEVFSPTDLEIAEWIKANTAGDVVFLTSDAHNHCVHSIAGRQIVMGFVGWLWSHGLSYSEAERDVRQIYATADCALIKKYEIDYVFIGPQENKLNPNTPFFESRFEKVFETRYAFYEYKIFRTNC